MRRLVTPSTKGSAGTSVAAYASYPPPNITTPHQTNTLPVHVLGAMARTKAMARQTARKSAHDPFADLFDEEESTDEEDVGPVDTYGRGEQ